MLTYFRFSMQFIFAEIALDILAGENYSPDFRSQGCVFVRQTKQKEAQSRIAECVCASVALPERFPPSVRHCFPEYRRIQVLLPESFCISPLVTHKRSLPVSSSDIICFVNLDYNIYYPICQYGFF